MNMLKKPKKPAPRKEITLPTWGKINMNNKYDSLLDLDRLSESDESASDNSTDSPSRQPTFDNQMQTIQLQRKVKYLKQKLIEKTEDKVPQPRKVDIKQKTMITKIEETPQPKQNKKPHLNPKVTLPTDNSQKEHLREMNKIASNRKQK